MNNLIIRQAKIEDVPALLPLIKDLEYPTDELTLIKRFKKFTKYKDYGVVVACVKEDIVGFISWSVSYLFVSDTHRFHIEGIIVDKDFQRQGIGKKLLQFVEQEALKYSPVIIDLTSGLRRQKYGTHKFYRNLGYSNEGHMAKLYLRKKL